MAKLQQCHESDQNCYILVSRAADRGVPGGSAVSQHRIFHPLNRTDAPLFRRLSVVAARRQPGTSDALVLRQWRMPATSRSALSLFPREVGICRAAKPPAPGVTFRRRKQTGFRLSIAWRPDDRLGDYVAQCRRSAGET